MREGPAAAEDLLARNILEIEVRLSGIRDALVAKAEVEINGCASPIKLGDASGDERFARKLPPPVLGVQPSFYRIDERQNIAPGGGGFERLGDDVIVHQEVANIRDAIGKLIAAPAILAPRLHAVVARAEALHHFLLLVYLAAGAFEDESTDNHFFALETFHLGDEELLYLTL